MTGQSTYDIIDGNSCLLVSDSNEVGEQYDSKKLKQSELVELAQENLFKKVMDIMSLYMTNSQYEAYKELFDQKCKIQNDLFNSVNDSSWNKPHIRFKPVDGQVILIDKEIFTNWNDSQSSEGRMTPMQFIREWWDITSDFSVEQIHDCMLRGVTEVSSTPMKKSGNSSVGVTEENMPPHMHNSCVTTGSSMASVRTGANTDTGNGYLKNETRYDIFYNDSLATGLDRNELQGTVDDFGVEDAGTAEVSAGEPRLMHNNLPKYRKFYAFVITRNVS